MSEPIRILVVDDHNIVRQGLVALLNTVPDLKVVAEASDGEEAITVHRQHQHRASGSVVVPPATVGAVGTARPVVAAGKNTWNG